jgi:hypothetical protein
MTSESCFKRDKMLGDFSIELKLFVYLVFQTKKIMFKKPKLHYRFHYLCYCTCQIILFSIKKLYI